jgi:hypothetical protein
MECTYYRRGGLAQWSCVWLGALPPPRRFESGTCHLEKIFRYNRGDHMRRCSRWHGSGCQQSAHSVYVRDIKPGVYRRTRPSRKFGHPLRTYACPPSAHACDTQNAPSAWRYDKFKRRLDNSRNEISPPPFARVSVCSSLDKPSHHCRNLIRGWRHPRRRFIRPRGPCVDMDPLVWTWVQPTTFAGTVSLRNT